MLCVTADSPSYPRRHREIAERIAREFHLPHEFVETSELDRPEYRANPANRCYYCKTELYEHLSELATAAASRRSSTAATPTTAATTGRAGRRRASSACGARSTRPI